MTAHPDGTPHDMANRVSTMLVSLRLTLCMATAALATGCASTLTGYQSETEHTCPNAAGKGLPCTPVSDVFKRAMAGQLPGQLADGLPSPGAVPGGVASYGAAGPTAANVASAALRPAMSSGLPVRTAPRVLRIWFAPWKDDLDVLHDQRHSYLTLDTGRWLIEHNQQRMIQQFAPTRLLQGSGEPTDQAPAASRPQATVPATPAQRAANPAASSLPFGPPAANPAGAR